MQAGSENCVDVSTDHQIIRLSEVTTKHYRPSERLPCFQLHVAPSSFTKRSHLRATLESFGHVSVLY